MNNMKPNYIIKFLVLLLFAATGQEAFAQWAGPDQEILSNDDNTQTVTLSVVDYDPQACYEWTGPNIQGDSHQPTITANPQNETQTYICTRTGRMGVDQDAVVVYVYAEVEIVAVSPKKDCFEPGDFINETDFEIHTTPSQYSSLVRVSPLIIPTTFLADASFSGQSIELTFYYENPSINYRTEKVIPVHVIDKNANFSLEVDPRFGTLKRKFDQ